MLAWTQFIAKQHDIIIVTIRSDNVSRNKRRKDKLIMHCEREEKTTKGKIL